MNCNIKRQLEKLQNQAHFWSMKFYKENNPFALRKYQAVQAKIDRLTKASNNPQTKLAL